MTKLNLSVIDSGLVDAAFRGLGTDAVVARVALPLLIKHAP
jgi:hypothetical protein